MEQRESQRRFDRRRTEVVVQPVDQGAQRAERARCVEREQLAWEPLQAGRDRVPGQQPVKVSVGAWGLGGACHVRLVGGSRPLLSAAYLVAARGAAVALAERPVGITVPDELVDNDRAPAGGAPGRELAGDRLAEARVASGVSGQRLHSSVEVTDVRRAQHDLGEQPGEGRRLERVAPPELRDRSARNPATPPEQVNDHITRARTSLDLRRDHVQGWGRGQPLEHGQNRPLLRPDEGRERL